MSEIASNALLVLVTLATVLVGSDTLDGRADGTFPAFALCVPLLLALFLFRRRIGVAARFTTSLALVMLVICVSVLNNGFNTPNQYLALLMLVVLSEITLNHTTTLAFQIAASCIVLATGVWFVYHQPPVSPTTDVYDPKNWARVLFNFTAIVIATTMCLRHMTTRFRRVILEAESTAAALRQETAARLEEAETTRRLQARVEQTQRVEAMGRLASGVAHDFSNLLTVIVASAESLRFKAQLSRDGEAAAATSEDEILESILTAARKGSELSHELLTFGRRYGEQSCLAPLDTAVRDAFQLVSRLVPPRIQLELTLDAPNLWVTVCPGDITQILMNLVVNARDAMPDGGTVRVTTAAPQAQPATGFLTVADTGLGISADLLPKVFDPFFTTKAEGEGTGLGLSIVDTVVKRLGGTIGVKSQLGEGSAFVIQLPAANPSAVGAEDTQTTVLKFPEDIALPRTEII